MQRLFIKEKIFTTLGFLLHLIFVAIPKDFWSLIQSRPKRVDGTTIVITGGASGIGKRVAELLAIRHKAKVAILDVDIKNASETVDEIKKQGGIAEAWQCDIGSPDELKRCSEAITRKFGHPKIVICNAAILHLGYALHFSNSQLQDSLKINILGTIYTIRTFLSEMEKRNEGHVVALSSIAGFYGETYGMAYCASKFAIRGIMESIENEMRDRKLNGIRFTTVCPYFTKSPMILNKKMRPVSTWFPFLSVRYCSKEIVNAILREKTIAFVPKELAILTAAKGLGKFSLLTKHIRIAGRKYINCRYEPNVADNDEFRLFHCADDFFAVVPYRAALFEAALATSVVIAISGGYSWFTALYLCLPLLLIMRLISAILTLHLCDSNGFSNYCTFKWFIQSSIFGFSSALHLRLLSYEKIKQQKTRL